MKRDMTLEDLGDLKLYEDEAIREQAARLQMYIKTLRTRLENSGIITEKTWFRLLQLKHHSSELYTTAEVLKNGRSL